MIKITSSSNDHFKRLSALTNAKGIKKHGEFILMGERLVREFLQDTSGWTVKSEVLVEGAKPVTSRGTTQFEFSKDLFEQVDVLGTKSNLIVLEKPELPRADLAKEPRGLELVCPLGDPANLGAILRSALAFGASKVILTEEAASPFHPKAIKASAGAALRLSLETTGPLASYRSAGSSFALDMDGETLSSWKAPTNLRLIVGEEGPGLPELKSVPRLSVPTQSVESLNAVVAASVVLYAWANRRS